MMRLPLRIVWGDFAKGALGLGLLSGVTAGCVDPSSDYDDFVHRPVALKEAGPAADVAQSPCQEVLSQNASGKFFGSCLVKAVGTPFSLAVEQTVRPSTDGTMADMDIVFTALTTMATSLSDTTGNPTMKTVAVDSDCRYRENVGMLTLPAAANTLGRDVESLEVVLRGKLLTADRSCAELDGRVSSPITLSFADDGDICVYVRALADGSLPMIPMSEYVCDPSILQPR